MAKLVAHRLATAALWVRIHPNIQNGRHKHRNGQHSLLRQKNIRKKNIFSRNKLAIIGYWTTDKTWLTLILILFWPVYQSTKVAIAHVHIFFKSSIARNHPNEVLLDILAKLHGGGRDSASQHPLYG